MSHERDPWIASEPGFGEGLKQLARLFRRGCGRFFTACLWAALFAGLAVAVVALKQHKFAPSFTLRVLEADAPLDSMPSPKRRLREHMRDAVFSSGRLMQLMDSYDLYPSLRHVNPRAAIDSFRKDIDIRVYRNYFVQARSAHEEPRSARISIRYMSDDPTVALEVTRALGRLVIETEERSRQREMARALSNAQQAVDHADRELSEQQRRLALVLAGDSQDPATTIGATRLRQSIDRLERLVQSKERRAARLALGNAYESHRLGLSFEVVDEGAIRPSAKLHPRDLMILAAVLFTAALPFSVFSVGAFDMRTHDAEDLNGIDLELLTVIPKETPT